MGLSSGKVDGMSFSMISMLLLTILNSSKRAVVSRHVSSYNKGQHLLLNDCGIPSSSIVLASCLSVRLRSNNGIKVKVHKSLTSSVWISVKYKRASSTEPYFLNGGWS